MILLMISIVWAQSDEWKKRIWGQVDYHMSTQDALPPLLETGRALYPDVEQWAVVDVSADLTKETVEQFFIKEVAKDGVAPYLWGMSELIERSTLSLTPRSAPEWDEPMVTADSQETFSSRQMGPIRYYKDGELEAIAVDKRSWSTETAYSFSNDPYYNHWTFRRYLFIYRSGVAVGVYIYDSIVDMYPKCTKEDWKNQAAIRNPGWDSLMGQSDVRHYEHILVFHYNEAKSLSAVEIFEFANLTPSYLRYEPVEPSAAPK